jgi:hypothetical protein
MNSTRFKVVTRQEVAAEENQYGRPSFQMNFEGVFLIMNVVF